MNPTVARVLPALLPLAVCGCGLVLPKEMPWAFVEAVGGIAVDAPAVEGRTMTLPVRANVSGTQAITTQPTALNSALLCPATHAKVKGRDILVTITTNVMGHGEKSAVCPPATLCAPPAGVYRVFYGSSRAGAVPLGEITVVR